MDKTELLGLDVPELEQYLQTLGEPAYRGRQIYQWIYRKNVTSFYEMSDLPRELRVRLDSHARVSAPRFLKQRVASDGTRKFLLELNDKKRIESVAIPQGDPRSDKYTLCVSTQVGCPMACAFCATGKGGFQRHLQAYEIAGQVLSANRELAERLKSRETQKVGNVVYMGMGEPMLNYDQVIKSVYVLNNTQGINIGQRHITISTAGEAEGIERLGREKLQVTLAVSLHACDDELRSRLMPINRKYPLERLIQAVESFIAMTGRRVTFEYVLLAGVNDRREDARNMIKLLKPLLANVNLIPYNEVDGLPFLKPGHDAVYRFQRMLEQGGLTATVRQEMGADIEAACGQLKAST